MEIYKQREYDLQNEIDNILGINGTFQNYKDEVNRFIDNLLNETIEINTLRHSVKEKDKEIERLTAESTEWESKCYKYQDIIDELEKYTIEQINIVKENMQIIGNEGKRMATRFVVYNEYLDKLKALKEVK